MIVKTSIGWCKDPRRLAMSDQLKATALLHSSALGLDFPRSLGWGDISRAMNLPEHDVHITLFKFKFFQNLYECADNSCIKIVCPDTVNYQLQCTNPAHNKEWVEKLISNLELLQ
jgi:hypothetical protein